MKGWCFKDGMHLWQLAMVPFLEDDWPSSGMRWWSDHPERASGQWLIFAELTTISAFSFPALGHQTLFIVIRLSHDSMKLLIFNPKFLQTFVPWKFTENLLKIPFDFFICSSPALAFHSFPVQKVKDENEDCNIYLITIQNDYYYPWIRPSHKRNKSYW